MLCIWALSRLHFVRIFRQYTDTMADASLYSVPREAQAIYENGILKSPLIARDLPPEVHAFASSVKFVGSSSPSLPVKWRLAESAASLKPLEASIISALLKRKYNTTVSSVTINTDHAQLFFFSTLLWTIIQICKILLVERRG